MARRAKNNGGKYLSGYSVLNEPISCSVAPQSHASLTPSQKKIISLTTIGEFTALLPTYGCVLSLSICLGNTPPVQLYNCFVVAKIQLKAPFATEFTGIVQRVVWTSNREFI